MLVELAAGVFLFLAGFWFRGQLVAASFTMKKQPKVDGQSDRLVIKRTLPSTETLKRANSMGKRD